MSTDTPADPRALLTEGRKHDEAMTAGPWHLADEDGVLASLVDSHDHDRTVADCQFSASPDIDANGIAWMRTNLPELLAGYTTALDEVNSVLAANRRLAAEIVALTEIQNRLTERNQAALDAAERLRAGLSDLRSSLLASSTVALSRRAEWAEQIDRLLTPPAR